MFYIIFYIISFTKNLDYDRAAHRKRRASLEDFQREQV